MAVFTFTYLKSEFTSLSGANVDQVVLRRAVEDDPTITEVLCDIGSGLQWIDDAADPTFQFGFETALSGPSETALDAIVAAHAGPVDRGTSPRAYLRAVDPAVTDDEDAPERFAVGNIWVNTVEKTSFTLVDATATAAIWEWTSFAGAARESEISDGLEIMSPQAHTPNQVLVTEATGATLSDVEDLVIAVSTTNYTPSGATIEDHLQAIDGELGSVDAHASAHILGGGDEIDGDQLDIDFTPSNYTPDTAPAEVTNVDHLSAHLAGIDNVLAAVSPFPQAIRACRLEWQSTTTIRITPGSAVDSTDAQIITNTTNRDVDTSTTGANGLDTGTLAASTEYYLFLAEGGSGVTGLASLSQTSPTLPAGFDQRFRRVGVFLSDATPDVMNFLQSGSGTTRRYYWRESRTGILEVLTSGTATTFTVVGLSAALPSIADSMQLMINDASNNRDLTIRESGSSQATGVHFVHASSSIEAELVNVSQQLEYQNSGGGGDANIAVIGFTESLDG